MDDWNDDDDIMDFEPVKSKLTADSEDSFTYLQPDPQYLGRKIKMKFDVGETTKRYEWYSGQILNFDPISGKYGAFFPSDQQTVYIDPVKEAEDIHYL